MRRAAPRLARKRPPCSAPRAALAGGASEGGGVPARAGGGGGAAEEVFDGEDSEAREVAPVGRVEARADGLFEHVAGGRLQGDEDADGGLPAVEDADEVADVAGGDLAALDPHDDVAGGLALAFEVADEAVAAGVGLN